MDVADDAPLIPNGVVICSDKGGAGKSRVASELIVSAADAGWRTLAVDLDFHAALSKNLGCQHLSDQGRGLYDAVLEGTPLSVVHSPRGPEHEPEVVFGRANLDMVSAGKWTMLLASALNGLRAVGDQPAKSLGTVIAELCDTALAEGRPYDLVVFDCRPDAGDALLLQAIASSGFAVATTFQDENDLEGVDRVRQLLVERAHREGWNRNLELLGAAVLGWPRESGQVKYQELARNLEEVTQVRAFGTPISDARMAIAHMVKLGLTSAEYARKVETEARKGKHARKLADEGWKLSVVGKRYSKSLKRKPMGEVVGGIELGGGLAADCYDLCHEILGLVRDRLAAAAEAEVDEAAEPVAVNGGPAVPRWDALLESEGSTL